MSIIPNIGQPGMGPLRTAQHRTIFKKKWGEKWLAVGKTISGSASADPGQAVGYTRRLRAGLLMGKITSGGKYAPSVLGLSGEAMDANETVMTVPEAVGDEIVRRLGTSGTFKLTGPPTAAGTVRTLTVTYASVAAASGGNRDVTITAMGVGEVQTVTFGAAASAGSMRLIVPKPSGEMVITAAITWDTTDATWLSNINTALDAATGTTAGIVASGATPDTVLIFTFDRTQYFGPQAQIQIHTFPTGPTTAIWADTTAGVDGRFVTGSLIQPVDGSETIKTFLPCGHPIMVVDLVGTAFDVDFPMVPLQGEVDASQIINYPADTSTRAWIKAALNAVGEYEFDDDF